MHGAGPYSLLGGLLLQLHQNDVRLHLDQPPDQLGVDAAGSTTLWHPLVTAALTLGGGDLQHPAVANIEPLSHLSHRAFTCRIGRQHLAPKIIAICSRHLLTISEAEAPAKNLALYLKVKWSRSPEFRSKSLIDPSIRLLSFTCRYAPQDSPAG
jgi:hypothetical protein